MAVPVDLPLEHLADDVCFHGLTRCNRYRPAVSADHFLLIGLGESEVAPGRHRGQVEAA